MRKMVLTFLILAAVSSCLAKYSGGTGDPNDPYQIANITDLLTLANDANDYNKCFIMTADLNLDPNLSGNQTFRTAVIARDINNKNTSFDGNAFTGVFDGGGHKITKLTIDTNGVGNDYLGLFGDINGGEVKNLSLKSFSITGIVHNWNNFYSENIGGLTGYNAGTISNCYSDGVDSNGDSIGGLVGYNMGTISNCYSAASVSNGNGIGGLAGYNKGIISNCYSTGTITGLPPSFPGIIGYNYIGGFVGYNKGTISNCYSTGATTGSNDIGGLVGRNDGGNISDSYSLSTVGGGSNSYHLGGLVGSNNSGSISGCYARCSISADTGSKYLGGLVGLNNGNVSDCYAVGSVGTFFNQSNSSILGGLVGDNNGGCLVNCYSSCSIYGSSPKGGLVGTSEANIIGCCFNSSAPINGYGTPLTSAQMKQQASFVGWDFINTWFINEGVILPQLRHSGPTPGYPGGSGTPDDPYRIATKADLLALGANQADYYKCFILTADINLYSRFTSPIIAPDTMNMLTAFTGTFDGNGHKITNISFIGSSPSCLFGYIGSVGSVKNLGIENFSVSLGSSASALACKNEGTISNCYASVNINIYWGSGSGLVGVNKGYINNSYSAGTITGTSDGGTAGGLVAQNDNGTISNCYSTCAISGFPGLSNVGGLVGDKGQNGSGVISSSYFLNVARLNNGYGTPLTDEQMKQQSSFVGWDFNSVWRMRCEGMDYPKLSWQTIPVGDLVCPDGVGFEDLAEFCSQWLLEEIPADVKPSGGDGIVDFADFAVFASQWGVTKNIDDLLNFTGQWLKVGLPVCSADISSDGQVNSVDFALLAKNWLQGF